MLIELVRAVEFRCRIETTAESVPTSTFTKQRVQSLTFDGRHTDILDLV